ncbi:terminase small subunit [Schleiferilactobacillus harbinensis]|uniref:Terminase n=1 Tax=Schleiferilactobacillus harbinensis TaxID=304207 RepID=A0A5P8M707_9LACO|nr:terminase small subunit [Schleiferilactobacillus harbinensis]QFR24097.1 terminase [Schleiferilactobacillus harbinensis]
MARKRDPARNLARELWIKSNKKAKLKDIAEQLGKAPSQVRKWKSEDKWEQTNGNAPNQEERSFSNGFKEVIEGTDAPDKQKLFATLYLRRFNATWAYMKAYGASYETSMVNGSRLLRNTKIAKLIDQLKAEQMAELHVTNMDLLQELAKQAKSDVGDYLDFATEEHGAYTDDGQPIPDPETKKQLTYHRNRVYLKPQEQVDTSLIKSVAIEKGQVKLELYDKQKAIDMLLRNLPTAAATRKADAEARVAKYNADQLEGKGTANPILAALSEVLNKGKKGTDHEDATD